MGHRAYKITEMITISISNIFALYIGLFIFIVLAAFIYNRRRGVAFIEDKKLFSCPVCAYHYIINAGDKIHRCPQCESLNTADLQRL